MARYGKFSGVSNYIVLAGKKSKKLEELCGYYGERITLKIQQLGLNTCWAAMSFKKIPSVLKINKGEKILIEIAFGYGKNNGVAHKSKTIEQVSNYESSFPSWFKDGVECALLAPTALNQQKFFFSYDNDQVIATAGVGFYTKVDLGIAKYHFEIASKKKIDI